MPTLNSMLPVIADADLQAAREFLNMNTASSVDRPQVRRKPGELTSRAAAVTVHHGITRARGRSASKPQV